MLLHLQRVKVCCCSLGNNQNKVGCQELIPQNGCANSIFQTPHSWHERLMDLLQRDRLKMFLGCSNQKEIIYQLGKSEAVRHQRYYELSDLRGKRSNRK